MTLTIWHLLALIPITIGIVSVALTGNDRAIGRWAFFIRLFVLCAFGVALSFVLRQRDENVAAATMVLYVLAAWYLVPYWASARLRDMGSRSKYWAVLTNVPVIGWLYTLYLLCAKGKSELVPQSEDDLPPLVPQEILQPAIGAPPPVQEPRRIAS
jgi:uncharacterized membrane protein YhaH (DUF805 family)